MEALKLLWSTDAGLYSSFTILFIVVMGIFVFYLVKKKV